MTKEPDVHTNDQQHPDVRRTPVDSDDSGGVFVVGMKDRASARSSNEATYFSVLEVERPVSFLLFREKSVAFFGFGRSWRERAVGS